MRNYLSEYMHTYLVACTHEYLVRREVFIFAAFLWSVSSEWPGETVYLPRLKWVIDISITDSFVLLIGMYFKYMCFNMRRIKFEIKVFYTYYSKKINTEDLQNVYENINLSFI